MSSPVDLRGRTLACRVVTDSQGRAVAVNPLGVPAPSPLSPRRVRARQHIASAGHPANRAQIICFAHSHIWRRIRSHGGLNTNYQRARAHHIRYSCVGKCKYCPGQTTGYRRSLLSMSLSDLSRRGCGLGMEPTFDLFWSEQVRSRLPLGRRRQPYGDGYQT
eukprot:6179042-Pleurochrysis_carterae.AAC.5